MTVTFAILALGGVAFARDKTLYQTTKLIELNGGTTSFCFVVQVDDLAYVATATGRAPGDLIVGDPVQIKIKGDNILVKVHRKFLYDADDVKTRIVVRKRMAGDAKLPTCALAVAVH